MTARTLPPLGSALRACCTLAGLSQDAMGDLLGCAGPTVQSWETGQREMTASRLIEFAAVCGVDPETLGRLIVVAQRAREAS